MTTVITEPYPDQRARWPTRGRHLLADHDDDTIVVYQAYAPSIAAHAVAHQTFGGDDFRYTRMSWVKPGFLWMMHRSDWATAPGQERVLAIRLPRAHFDQLLATAVASSFGAAQHTDADAWRRELRQSDVRLQWDPDHGPRGEKLDRRAIQLGLRSQTLRDYGKRWIVELRDITPFVHDQRQRLRDHGPEALELPPQRLYPVDPATADRIRLDPLDAPA